MSILEISTKSYLDMLDMDFAYLWAEPSPWLLVDWENKVFSYPCNGRIMCVCGTTYGIMEIALGPSDEMEYISGSPVHWECVADLMVGMCNAEDIVVVEVPRHWDVQ